MFKKIRITVNTIGQVQTSEPLAHLHAESVQADMAEQRRRLRNEAMGLGRIDTIETTMTSLVVIYTGGTVVIYQWIAE